MKTKAELDQIIMNINKRIPSEFRESSKKMNEIPQNNSGINTGEFGNNGLKTYYNSLAEIVTQHTKNRDEIEHDPKRHTEA